MSFNIKCLDCGEQIVVKSGRMELECKCGTSVIVAIKVQMTEAQRKELEFEQFLERQLW